MWIENVYIVPEHVTHVTPYKQKKLIGGAVTSKGCVVWFVGGESYILKSPTTQVVAILGLTYPRR